MGGRGRGAVGGGLLAAAPRRPSLASLCPRPMRETAARAVATARRKPTPCARRHKEPEAACIGWFGAMLAHHSCPAARNRSRMVCLESAALQRGASAVGANCVRHAQSIDTSYSCRFQSNHLYPHITRFETRWRSQRTHARLAVRAITSDSCADNAALKP